MPARMDSVKVLIDSKFIDRKDWIKYLILVNWHAQTLGDVVRWAPNAAFKKFLETQVQSYLKGNEPPQAIQSAVLNLADDYLAGRELTLRAGDYLALQNHFRSMR